MTKQLADYIDAQLKKNISEQDILTELTRVGHDKNVILPLIRARKKQRIINTYTYIFTVSAVIILLTTLFVFYQPIPQQAIPEELAPSVPLIPDNEIYFRALATGNPLFCEDIQDLSLRELCRGDFMQEEQEPLSEDNQAYFRALETADSSYCEQIEEEALRQLCREDFTTPTEALTDDNQVYVRALSTGNPALCQEITDAATRELCVSDFS